MARPTINGDIPKSTLWAVKLKRLGYRSLSHWAKYNNFPVDTVITTVQRWGNRSDIPLGGFAREIMERLRADTEITVGTLVPVED